MNTEHPFIFIMVIVILILSIVIVRAAVKINRGLNQQTRKVRTLHSPTFKSPEKLGHSLNYKTPESERVVSKSGRDLTKLTDGQQYVVRTFFNQYHKKKPLSTTGKAEILITNHVGDTFVFYASSEGDLTEHLNKIFAATKSVNTYRRMYSKKPKTYIY